MTLNDLATLICTKVNQNEPEDLAAAKLFAGKRYQMIWQDQLWKDSIIDWTYTLPAAGTPYQVTDIWLPTKQNLILPAQFERVLAVRTDTRKLNIQSQEVFYRTDYDAFANGGMLVDFLRLPPVVWEFDRSLVLWAKNTNNGDQNKQATVDVLQSDGATESRDTVTMNLAVRQQVDIVQRIDQASKAATAGTFLLGAGPTMKNGAAAQHTLTFYDASNSLLQTMALAVGQSGAFNPNSVKVTVDAGSSMNLFAGQMTLLTLQDAGGGTFNAGVNVDPVYFYTFQPADLAGARRQRIHLMGTVDVPAPTIRVLGKAVPNTFTGDNDSTALAGVDHALIAIVEHDMLQRERQYAKAQVKLQEYGALLEQLKKAETIQQAHQKQIKPEDGYGNPFDLWSHPPLTF